MKLGVFLLFAIFNLLGAPSLLAAFGLTTSTNSYTVDTDAGLVFKVRRTDNGSSTQSAGDLMSLVYNGVEYQNQSRGSHINSGFDFLYHGVSAVSVSAATVGADFIKITVVAGDLTHYYLARRGFSHITMATHFTSEPSTLGLCRFIVRIPEALLPNGPEPSDIRGNAGAIESADIFGMPDGTTRSKHYSNMRLIDWQTIGATGPGVGVWMARSNHEGDSGGPFYRSLLNQCGADQEITYIINYGEAQTEPFRTNILNGPYTLIFTNGAPPPALDHSWVAQMGLIGFVGAEGRGSVAGAGLSARDASYAYTVGFANATAQYWTDVAPSDGAFLMSGMLPGTYTIRVFKNELAVHTASVVVNGGATTSVAAIGLAGDPSRVLPRWRIGQWDGSPAEFLNGDKVTTMHPSDVRMADWNPGAYVVGTSTPAAGMPCYQWKEINGTQVVRFNLTAAQLVASTIRIGITVAFEGARPRIAVNDWSSANPAPSTQPETRTLTVGTYRGNNTTFAFAVPASAFVVGMNTMWISPISGSGAGGFLSAGYSLDCVDMFQGTAQTLGLPGAPTALTATSGDEQITLTWPTVPGVAGYLIQRALASGGPFTPIASGLAGTTFTDTGRSNGTTYFYTVHAMNSTGAGAPSPQASATAGAFLPPVAIYALEGNANDTSGNGHHGTPTNVAYTAGIVGTQAGSFNGTSSHIRIPTSITEDFTVSFWAKTTNTGGTGTQWWSGRGMVDGEVFGVVADWGTALLNGRFAFGVGNPETTLSSSVAINDGAWHHLVATRESATGAMRVYVDGVLRGSTTGATGPRTAPPFLRIGGIATGGPYHNGAIDHVVLYDRVVGPAEIATISIPSIAARELIGPPITIAAGGQVNFTFPTTVRGRTYQLQRRDSLTTGVWMNIGVAQVGDGNSLILSDAAAGFPQRFYRVRLGP